MKKIITLIFAVSLLSSAAFANFFSQRYFEIKVGTSFDVSNNLFSANEYLRKDLVIDLKKIADQCPDKGFNLRADMAPELAVNLNIKDFHLGFSSGVDLYENLEVGKDLFDFLGYGNTVGETLDFTITNDLDVFTYSQMNLGFKVGKLKLNFQPAVFVPVVSVRGAGGKATVLNDSEGNLNVDVDMNMDVYSVIELKYQDNKVEFDPASIEAALKTSYGFDLGGGFTYPLSKTLNLGATCRIPVIPGYLYNKANVNTGFEYKMKITDFSNAEKTSKDITVTNEAAKLAIHRPLKVNAYLDKNLLGTLFNARAGGGFGIRRPFSDDAVFYPEYYLGLTLNLIDMLKIGVSTQYKDQLFIHQLGTTFNLRLIQWDFGISTQSSSFKKSLSVAGVGAYTYITVGF